MNEKYSPSKIREALQPYESRKDDVVYENSIVPRFYNKDSETIMFVNRKYPLYGLNFMPSHMYTIIDGKVFHPGSPKREIFDASEDREGSTVSVNEMCIPCGYKKMLEMFSSDMNFNIFTNNCQMVMGQYFETIFLGMMYTLLLAYVFWGKVLFLVLSIILALFVILFERLSAIDSSIRYTSCPHVMKLVKLNQVDNSH